MLTAGGDGSLVTWNINVKSKYKSLEGFPMAIQVADFQDEGTMIAYTVGYDWSQGHECDKKNEPTSLIVRLPEKKDIAKT
jgi:mRNA export factor